MWLKLLPFIFNKKYLSYGAVVLAAWFAVGYVKDKFNEKKELKQDVAHLVNVVTNLQKSLDTATQTNKYTLIELARLRDSLEVNTMLNQKIIEESAVAEKITHETITIIEASQEKCMAVAMSDDLFNSLQQ